MSKQPTPITEHIEWLQTQQEKYEKMSQKSYDQGLARYSHLESQTAKAYELAITHAKSLLEREQQILLEQRKIVIDAKRFGPVSDEDLTKQAKRWFGATFRKLKK